MTRSAIGLLRHDRHRPIALTVRIPHNQLIAAECNSLTGGTPSADGVADCVRTDQIARSAYVRTGLDVITRARTAAGLVEGVTSADFDATRFRIDVHDPNGRLTSPSRDLIVALADGLRYHPDLENPLHRFVVVSAQTDLCFGEVVAEARSDYRRHDKKPWTTSSSLSSRFARALVNLVPDAVSILDPCCGAGAIVLEAASLGIEVRGVDWKPAMAGMTAKNLEHFGYVASVERADAREIDHTAEAVVTDLPYGNAIVSDAEVIRAVLARASRLAPVGVFVSGTDICEWLHDAGYSDIEVFTVHKRAGFTRYVHRAHV